MRKRQFFTLVCAVIPFLCSTAPVHAQAPCRITGPETADVNQSFTLCGPTGSGYTYEWSGPGIRTGADARCVTARVSTSGTYEFLLILRRYDDEIDRCRAVVNVGGTSGGTRSCEISGPATIEAGRTARLCSPEDGLHTYRWTGPNGFTSTSGCITVDTEGDYTLTSRNRITGSTRQCVHRLTVIGGPSVDCVITGPEVIPEGTTAQLCGPVRNNTSYRWVGPGRVTGTSRCLTVRDPGTYTLTMRNERSGRTERCSHILDWVGEEDPDETIWENCPRPLQYWRARFGAGRGANDRGELSQADLRAIARRVDERSTYFNWTNDMEGMRRALSPGRSMTRRQQLARQFAALLANVAAGELDWGPGRGDAIGLDPNTPINVARARTVRDLIEMTDRQLTRNRGNFARINSALTDINNGRGIGPVCE